MPILESTFRPVPGLGGAHLQTVLPTLFRRVPRPPYERQRLELPDGDFLLLDWCRRGHERLVILSTGMEGHAERAYVKGMVHALLRCGMDVVVWHMRGGGGEPNRKPHFYHAGLTDDLRAVIREATRRERRSALYAVGFSLGGALTLNCLAEDGEDTPIQKAAVLSTPLDFDASERQLSRRSNRVYTRRFLHQFHDKLKAKQGRIEGAPPCDGFASLRTLREYDQQYTAPLFGFDSAEHYYATVSPLQRIERIRVPTLIIQAGNDPFLSPADYPVDLCRNHPCLCLEVPRSGGHMGFWGCPLSSPWWAEKRVGRWLGDSVKNS